MAARAVIFGCHGTTLSADERDFFRAADPWGFILFGRNIAAPDQVLGLTRALRETVGRDVPVLIDQEGGRVARMRPPHWRQWAPALNECERLPDTPTRVRAMYLRYRIIADELRALGVDANCAPVLDLSRPETHPVLRNRCYGGGPGEVAEIGRAVADGLLAGGVLPIVKHMPGQGRALLDSHAALPVVTAGPGALCAEDFAPFRALADLPMAMTAHVIYAALDADRPATLSPVLNRIMRDEIGFTGLIMTDDLSMHALTGDFGDRARAAIAAGCDMILHCNGDPAEMAAVAEAAPELSGAAFHRADAALARRLIPSAGDPVQTVAEFVALAERVADA